LKAKSVLREFMDEASKVVVGQRTVMEGLLIALLAGGHVLLEGMPGLGKTLMSKTFARMLGGSFKRVQMTPDLLPGDILGVNVYNPASGSFSLKKGPVFANILMVDELNRASPRTQSALLEAMQERQVTIEGVTLPLERPFMVVATQLPYGSVGTYPLTEVQLDRFAFKLEVKHPSEAEELEIMSRVDEIEEAEVKTMLTQPEALRLMLEARGIHVSDRVKSYILSLVNHVRGDERVRVPPSPRASIWLMRGARARALMEGRDYAIPDDVKALAEPALGHRVVLTPEAEAAGETPLTVIRSALESTAVPKE